MTAFFGDYDTTETVYIPFNTFDSNDPSASVTATTLLNTDCHVHKDGGVTQRSSSSGETLSIDFDGVTGNHLLALDLSDNTDAGFYADGSTYQVRIEGATVDGANINAWIGAFSIGRTLRPADMDDIKGVGWAGESLTSVAADIAAVKADTAAVLIDTAEMQSTGVVLADSASHGGSSAVITLDHIAISSTTDHGISILTSAVDKYGIHINSSDATGVGINAVGSLHGIVASGGVGTGGNGFRIIANSTGDALFAGSTSGDEINSATITLMQAGLSTLAATDIVSDGTAINATAGVVDTVGAVTGAVGSVTGAVGSVTGSVGSVVGHTAQTGDTYALANGAAGFVAIDTVVDAIKVKTDDMVYTKANELDVNVQSINGAAVVGDGNATPWDGA